MDETTIPNGYWERLYRHKNEVTIAVWACGSEHDGKPFHRQVWVLGEGGTDASMVGNETTFPTLLEALDDARHQLQELDDANEEEEP